MERRVLVRDPPLFYCAEARRFACYIPLRDIAFPPHLRQLIWISRNGESGECKRNVAPGPLCGGITVIRSELVQKLCDDHPDLTVKEIERVVSAFFDSIIDQLQRGGRVELRGFGAFSTRDRDARKGRNPRTGDSVDVAAKRVPYFKPGKEMRERLNLQEGSQASAAE